MTVHAHTPGPWQLKRLLPDLVNITSEAGPVLGYAGVYPNTQRAADLQLMASAPQLLEACESAYQFMCDQGYEEYAGKILAAINEANNPV